MCRLLPSPKNRRINTHNRKRGRKLMNKRSYRNKRNEHSNTADYSRTTQRMSASRNQNHMRRANMPSITERKTRGMRYKSGMQPMFGFLQHINLLKAPIEIGGQIKRYNKREPAKPSCQVHREQSRTVLRTHVK